MKRKKLNLDKLNVVRLNNPQNIIGGFRIFNDGDTAGIGVEGSGPRPNNNDSYDLLTTVLDSVTGTRSVRSSLRCAGD